MLDNAAVVMAQGVVIAAERAEGRDDNMTSSHFHSFFELYYLEDGARQYVINDSLYEIKPHTMVVLPPHLMHHSYGGTGVPFKRVVVYWTKEGAAPGLFERMSALEGVHELTDPQDILDVEDLLNRLLAEDRDDGFSFTVKQSLLNLLLIKLLRVKAVPVEPRNVGTIKRIVRYISDHYAEDLSLDDLAQKFFISKYHLCREFKRYTRNTVIEYRNFIRILHAQRLFLESASNLSEIAQKVGFSSLTHFERVFKEVVGMTPNESRRQMLMLRESGISPNISLPRTADCGSTTMLNSKILKSSSISHPKACCREKLQET